jgi:hypothetical protein
MSKTVAQVLKVTLQSRPRGSNEVSVGTVSTGGVVSTTVMPNDVEPVLLELSVAEQVTTVIPSGKVVPAAGVQIGVSDPDTMSSVVAMNSATAPAALVASKV